MPRHALSFTKNPEFKSYIEAICSSKPLTLVLGAGVSIESGLPTWSGLLESLGCCIETPHLNDLITAEEVDPSRRADLILSALSEGSGLGDLDRIKSVLYTKTPRPNGVLLDSLAQLIRVLGSRVKIITLNYDDCLEYQLVSSMGLQASEVRPFGLREVDVWKKCENGVAILHVHGFVARDSKRKNKNETSVQWPDKEPIILSEGEYIEHGSLVQEIVRERAESSHLVFVGTSLSDANITHPLSMNYRRLSVKRKIKPAFALLVPDDRSALKVCQDLQDTDSKDKDRVSVQGLSEKYFSARCKHIQNTYGISVVRLNSYSQVAQAITEARLAVENQVQYLDNSEASSLRYGKRFKRIMRDVYSRLGVETGGVAPGGDSARCLSDELERVLKEEVHILLDEFLEIVKGAYCRKSIWHITEKAKLEEAKRIFSQEKFALYLWLRSALGEGDEFEVFIAGSSSYVRRDGAVMGQRSTVSPRSIYASARSVFTGGPDISWRPYKDNLLARPGEALDRPWNMYWSMPIVVSELDSVPGDWYGRVNAGAIVLQSSAFGRSPEDEFWPEIHSLLTLVLEDPVMAQRLNELLSTTGAEIVSRFSVKPEAYSRLSSNAF